MGLKKQQKDRYYAKLVELCGEVCQMCDRTLAEINRSRPDGSPGHVKRLDLDHIDRNKRHNAFDNFQLLCHSCNCLKDSRGKGKKNNVQKINVVNEISTDSPMSEELRKRNEIWPAFNVAVYLEVFYEKQSEKRVLINTCSYLVRCSQQTAEKYLQQMTSKYGRFEEVFIEGKSYVRLKLKSHVSTKEQKRLSLQVRNWKQTEKPSPLSSMGDATVEQSQDHCEQP
jgi:hypothetical protein